MLLPTTLPSAMSVLPPRRLHRHGQFRRAGAEGDDGEADHQRRDAEGQRQFRGAAHEKLRAADQRDQAENEHGDGHRCTLAIADAAA
jgi:hypothetical protein